METMTDFIFLDSKITADGDWNHKIKSHLLLGRKAMRNLDSVLKNRDTILLTKVHIVKTIFPVIMCRHESWTVKKAEHWRIHTSELYWRRLLRLPWTAWRSNQSIQRNQSWIFIGRTDAEAEAPILWTPYTKSPLTGKYTDAGKDWRQ